MKDPKTHTIDQAESVLMSNIDEYHRALREHGFSDEERARLEMNAQSYKEFASWVIDAVRWAEGRHPQQQ